MVSSRVARFVIYRKMAPVLAFIPPLASLQRLPTTLDAFDEFTSIFFAQHRPLTIGTGTNIVTARLVIPRRS